MKIGSNLLLLVLLAGCTVHQATFPPPLPIRLPVQDDGYTQIGNESRAPEPVTLVFEADFPPQVASVAGFQWSSNMVDWLDFGSVAYPVAGATLRGTNVQATAVGFYRAVIKP